MNKLLIAGVLVLGLSGCASFAGSTGQVSQNVAAAVTDTQTVASGGVQIAGDLAKAVASIVSYVPTFVSVAGAL